MHFTLKGTGMPTPGREAAERTRKFRGYRDSREGVLAGGRYRLGRIVGRGGFGTVYHATDIKTDEEVAVKIRDNDVSRSISQKRITSEIRALSQVSHKNIVSMKDAGRLDGDSYIVMEFLDGMDLDWFLMRERSVPYANMLPIVSQMCAGLGALHEAGIIHRDVKPHNVFLLRNGTVKILDFDLSRFSGQEEAELHNGLPGTIMGTPSYIAPEAIRGFRADHRADIYAVGTIMYRMLCGVLPIESTEVIGILAMILNHNPVPPSQRNPSVHAAADRIVMRALEKDPDRRFQSMEDMLSALRHSPTLGMSVPALRFGISEIGPEDPTVRMDLMTQTMLAAGA